jgi:hypothetical protein
MWSDDDWGNWRDRVYAPVATKVGATRRPYDLRQSFASLLISEGGTAVDVAAQIGDASHTTLNYYAKQFKEFKLGARTGAVELIVEARARVHVRGMYAGHGMPDCIDGPETASTSQADARIRTADPFITR